MRPEVVITPLGDLDEGFAEIAQKIIQSEFDRVPPWLWERACKDVTHWGSLQDDTKSIIEKHLGLSQCS